MTDKEQEEVRGPGVGGPGSELNLFIRVLQWNSFRANGHRDFQSPVNKNNENSSIWGIYE